jgi:hypothetical protein
MRIAILAIFLLLTGCGGGSNNPALNQSWFGSNSYQSTVVPFHTPSLVTTITPLVNNTSRAYARTQSYTEDLTGNGSENLIHAAAMEPNSSSTWHDSRITVLGWQNGKLVDQTSQWFNAGDNISLGANTLKFGDFDKNGYLDILAAGSTDINNFFSPSYIYFNNGSKFTRTTISPGTFNAHDAVVYDFFNTGFLDILFTDYGPNTTLAKNNQNGTFTNFTQSATNAFTVNGGSSFAAADFLGNNTATIIATDQCNSGCTQFNNKLYSIAIDVATQNLSFTDLNTLPTPRFALPKWASYNFGDGVRPPSHDVRAYAFDWNGTGPMDAIIISRPNITQNAWPEFSEIQFLKNNGGGNFTDETDNVLVGYDTKTSASYQPKFIDVNGDGRKDILLSGGDFNGTNNSSQILINTKDGKFVAAFQNIITDFSAQAKSMVFDGHSGNIVNIIKSPDNRLYLITEITYFENNTFKQAVYLSLLGSSTITSAEAVSTIKTQWPWMSDASVNTVLASTGATYLNAHIMDLDKALLPIGGLQIKNIPISGYISGIKIEGNQLPLQAIDSIGRNFSVNASPSVFNSSNWWSRNYVPDRITPSSQTEYLIGGSNFEYNNLKFGGNDSNWSIGTPLVPISDSLSISAQMTTLNYNPWVQFGGMWGSVNYSSMFESVLTHKKANWQNQFGYILNSTNISPGLITRVNDFHAVWLESGYATERFGFFAGIRPWIVNGSLNAELPTSVDTQGVVHYTNNNFKVNNPVNTYLRTVYIDTITKNLSYKLSGMFVDNGMYRTQLEFKYSY